MQSLNLHLRKLLSCWIILVCFDCIVESHSLLALEQAFVRKDYRTRITIEKNSVAKPHRPIWRSSQHQISFKGSSENSFSLASQFPLKMVLRFAWLSPLSQQLQNDPSTIAYFPGSFEEAGFALIEIRDSIDLKQYAVKAHESTGACGSIEALSLLALSKERTTHYPPVYREWIQLKSVSNLLQQIEADTLKSHIKSISERFTTRGHDSPEGLEVPTYLETLINQLSGNSASRLSIQKESISGSEQKNLIVKITGQQQDARTIVVGAHMDTILSGDPSGANPGSDDDASGVAILVELARLIATNSLSFDHTVELHAYAAEEVGLFGSKFLAQKYRSRGEKVSAMMQLDMTSFSHDSKISTIYFVSTDTSDILNRSGKDLLNTYLDGDYETLPLTGGTSDHKAWTEQNYPALFPFEHPQKYNKALHTPNDNMNTANRFDLTARFAKLALAFISHHAGLISAKTEYQSTDDQLSTDIKIAILNEGNSESTGLWGLAVAAPSTVKRISTCTGSDKINFICSDEPKTIPLSKNQNKRQFFVTSLEEPVALKTNQIRVLLAYNSEDRIVARRVVTLTKKIVHLGISGEPIKLCIKQSQAAYAQV